MDAAVAIEENDEAVAGHWRLPEGWCWTSVGKIALVIAGQSPPSETYNENSVGLPFFQGKAEFGERHPTVRKWCSEPTKIAETGDILISVRAPVGPTNVADAKCGIGRGLAAIRVNESAKPQWLLHWLRFSEQQLVARGTGTTFAAITGDVLREHRIPLAPLPEQRRIAARIDTMFAEIAEGEAALAAAREGLDTFRRALLKAAVTGELTKDWRAGNPVSETGHDLLARIARNLAVHAPRARRGSEALSLDASSLPKLPVGWAWTTLGGIADTIRNGTSAAPRAGSNEHQILRISAVRPLWIDETQIRFLDDSQANAAADATVEAGDLLFTRYNGSAELVGVGAIYRGRKRFYPDKIIRVRLESAIQPISEFVELAVNAGNGRKHIAANIKTTAGQQGLSGESLKRTPVPVPPPAEAAEILRRVSDALAASADTLAVLNAEAADAARLKQSILKAAFAGRLSLQDPTDEPAGVLLARVAASPNVKSTRRGRHRKSEE